MNSLSKTRKLVAVAVASASLLTGFLAATSSAQAGYWINTPHGNKFCSTQYNVFRCI